MVRVPVVVDTDVFSSRLIPDSVLARRYEQLLVGRAEFVSFQTAAELRYGARLREWGVRRTAHLERALAGSTIVHTGPQLLECYVALRVVCERDGHALHQRQHDADRWIAATAIRLGIPLVSNDGVFHDTPGLVFETLPTKT